MKKRLLAATMTMIIMMGSSISVMAAFEGDDLPDADQFVGIEGRVVSSNSVNNDDQTVITTDERNTNVYDISIGADRLYYELIRTTTANRSGDFSVRWDKSTGTYTHNTGTVTYSTSYSFASPSDATKNFYISNRSNFAISTITSNIVPNGMYSYDYTSAFTLDVDRSSDIEYGSGTEVSVTMDPTDSSILNGPHFSYNNQDIHETLAWVTFDFTPGDRVAETIQTSGGNNNGGYQVTVPQAGLGGIQEAEEIG